MELRAECRVLLHPRRGWGTSLGKRLFGLRVVSAAGGPASWWQIARRTAVSYLPNLIIASLVSSSSMW